MMDKLYMPDLSNGTYQNPILFCDYSDPDVIRVGDTYYMTASSFNYVPGLPLLVSKDLVNWELVNYALENIPEEDYVRPRHADGVWAPAIRWHEGYFYIYYGMPDEGIYMVRAKDALRRWETPVMVMPGKGLIDPCPFWDEDGCAYVVHGYARSRIGFNSWLGIFAISREGTRAIGDDHLLFDGTKAHPTIEGPKMYKRNGWYYIFAPAGGVAEGWQTVLRSRNILGPYEDRIVLRQGQSKVNGPHQGAWVNTPQGEDWFIHFQSRGLYGRITHLQPMKWCENEWPVIGCPVTGESWGEPVDAFTKPKGVSSAQYSLQASDDFRGALGLQWQFMGNHCEGFYRLSDGKLRLYAVRQPDDSGLLWNCPNVLTQKLVCPAFTAEISVDASGLQSGEQAGLGLIGGQYAYTALRRSDEGFKLIYVQSEGEHHAERILTAINADMDQITFRMTLLPDGYDTAVVHFEYSCGGGFVQIGTPFCPERHTWVGARIALFAMPVIGQTNGGYANFSALKVSTYIDKLLAAETDSL